MTSLPAWSADPDWLEELRASFAELLSDMADTLDDDEDNPPCTPDYLADFCGCESCYHREVITFFIPRVLEAAARGLLESTA